MKKLIVSILLYIEKRELKPVHVEITHTHTHNSLKALDSIIQHANKFTAINFLIQKHIKVTMTYNTEDIWGNISQ